MRNSGMEAVMVAEPSPGVTSCRDPGIQFDDQDFGPEERESEATRQLIWEKLVARLRTEYSARGP